MSAIDRDRVLADYQGWLSSRGYSAGTVTLWVRIARRLLDSCAGGVTPSTPEAATSAIVAETNCRTSINRKNIRTAMRRFYEFKGAGAPGSEEGDAIVADYEQWLKSRTYCHATIKARSRTARRVLDLGAEIPPEEEAIEIISQRGRTPGYRATIRTRVRSFYEYLRSRGAL